MEGSTNAVSDFPATLDMYMGDYCFRHRLLKDWTVRATLTLHHHTNSVRSRDRPCHPPAPNARLVVSLSWPCCPVQVRTLDPEEADIFFWLDSSYG